MWAQSSNYKYGTLANLATSRQTYEQQDIITTHKQSSHALFDQSLPILQPCWWLLLFVWKGLTLIAAQIKRRLQCSSVEGSHDTSITDFSCPSVDGGSSILVTVGVGSSAGTSLESRWSSCFSNSGEMPSSTWCAYVDFSEGNLGRDLRSGLFICGSDSLQRLLRETLSSRLSLSNWEDWPPFCLVPASGVLFWRPSFGDLALVVGICITE